MLSRTHAPSVWAAIDDKGGRCRDGQPDTTRTYARLVTEETAPTLMETSLERRFLGVVEVDSGTLLISDPAYVLPRGEEDRPGIDFQAVIDTQLKPNAAYPFADKLALLIGLDSDGPYGVWGDFDDELLVSVHIDMNPIGSSEDDD